MHMQRLDAVMVGKRWTLNVIVAFWLMLSVTALLSYYLRYADEPVRSDVIVLFVGDDWMARQKEAAKLLADGYARYLIIPAYNRLTYLNSNGIMLPIEHNYLPGNSVYLLRKERNYPTYYENTHFELLEARRIMDKLGFKSALIVSSPYHMRRIRIIAETVFKDVPKTIAYIPTSYEKHHSNILGNISWNMEWIFGEIIKIMWFVTYRH